MGVSVSELTALLLKELLSDSVDRLESDYYKQLLEAVERLERDAEFRGEAAVVRSTLRYIFLYRLEKEIAYLRKHGEPPQVELPEEEARILLQIENIINTILGRGSAPSSTPAAPESKRESEPKPINRKPARRVFEGSIVVFLQPHPRIIDKDVSLGPFAKGDIAHIPRRMAKELEEKGIVEILADK